jgi:DNA helicase-2/ATP-dependent DNA helicase PcrA
MSDILNRLVDYRAGTENRKKEPEKGLKKSELLLQSIEDCGFNMSQMKDVITTSGNQLIISIAGSGKTTTLILKIIYDVVSGEATRVVEVNGQELRTVDKILVSTFLKSGADELQSKIAYWQKKLNTVDTSKSITFSTLHAEFKRALTALGVSTPIIDEKTNSKNLREIVNKFGILYNGKQLNSEMFNNLKSALAYTRNRLDDKRFDHNVYADLCINGNIIESVLKEWKHSRRVEGLMDFEDLQEILYDECYINENQAVIDFLANRYKFIYVDEFQDTSQIQYALIRIYGSKAKKIVVIGDDDQTIYSWRGSYNKIITHQFGSEFPHTLSKLGINYRCPNNILKAIKPSIELNKDRFEKELKSAEEGGKVRLGVYPSYRKMGEDLSKLVQEDVNNKRSVAILCRVNSDGLLPALSLELSKMVDFAISGSDMTLDSYIGKSVLNIARLFTDRSTQAVRQALQSLTWNKFEVDAILSVCKNNRMSLWKIPYKDIEYSCPSIALTLKLWRKCYDEYGELSTLQILFDHYKTEVYGKNTQYNYVCRSVIDALSALLEDLINSSSITTVAEFLDEIDHINEKLKTRKKNYKNVNVVISTVHEFKGKEADSVYVWNDSEDVFPHRNVDITIEEELEEERRVHYIANTRARKISTIMHLVNRAGQFVTEMDLSDAEKLTVLTSNQINKPKKTLSVKDANTVIENSGYAETLKMLLSVVTYINGNGEVTTDYDKVEAVRREVAGEGLTDNPDAHQVSEWIKLHAKDWFEKNEIVDKESLSKNYQKAYDIINLAVFFLTNSDIDGLEVYLGDGYTKDIIEVINKVKSASNL